MAVLLHPLVEELVDVLKQSEISYVYAAKKIKSSPTALSSWCKGRIKPTKKSLAKIKKFLDKIDNGEISLVEQTLLPTTVIRVTGSTRLQRMYNLIHRIEREFGKLADCPEDNEYLIILRKHLRVFKED